MIPDRSSNTINKYTKLLFPYAYNILGTAADAEDAVQEVMVKYLTNAGEHIINEKNYLIKSVVNLAINMKMRQKRISGEMLPWLPEPVATDDAADRNLQLKDVLSYSLLVLMEKLSAKERAVFILRESFDYSHSEIAEVLAITQDHSRKLLSRAKSELFKPASKRTKARDAHERAVLDSFLSAIRQRDTAQLESLMAADIRFYADGGGKVPLVATFCKGITEVAALQMLVYHSFLRSAEITYTNVNYQPAFLSYVNGRLTSCIVFDVHPQSGTLLQINAVLDPDKLKSVSQVRSNPNI